MKKHIFNSALLLFAFVGCNKEAVSDMVEKTPAACSQTFIARVEKPEPAGSTKSFDASIKAFCFKEGDEIAVSDNTNISIFTATSIAGDETTFTIKGGETPLCEGESYKAWYPVSIAPGKGGYTGQYMMQQQKTSNGPIPDGKSINYSESLYEANPMYAESTDNTLAFKNLCGLICVTLTQPEGSDNAISQVIFQDKSKAVFGPFDIDEGKMVLTGTEPSFRRIASLNTNSKYINSSNKYYIALPEGSYDACEFIVQNNGLMKQRFPLKSGKTLNIQRNKIYSLTLNVDDLRYDLNDNDIILFDSKYTALGVYSEPANCYMVPAGSSSKFVFNATRGNETTPIDGIANVKVLWRSQSTSEMSAAQVVKDEGLEYRNGRIYFTVSNNRGNALIGAYDSSDNLLWSWHIWVISKKPGIDTYPGGTKVMNCNVGAIETAIPATGSDSNLLAGLYYQYGRKDPMPERQKNTTASVVRTGVLNSMTTAAGPVSIEQSIKNPGTFYTTTGRWTTDAAATWDGESKTLYDPCPAGYRVWNIDCWKDFSHSNFTAHEGKTFSGTVTNSGYSLNLGDDTTTFYATCGWRKNSDGKLSLPAAAYRAWARDYNGSNASFFNIQQSGLAIDGSKAIVTSAGSTAYAFGVRCEKIQ